MGKVQELKAEYGNQLTALINASFELKARSQSVRVEISDAARDRLDQREFHRVEAAERSAWIAAETEKLQTEYTRLELEMRAAIQEAVAQAERELSPKSATASDVLLASTMTEAQLIDAMDSAFGLGDAGEDAALLAFQMARQKDFEQAVAHALDAHEGWSELYEDIAEGGGDPDLDPGDRFEMFAADVPTAAGILGASQPDANVYGQMR